MEKVLSQDEVNALLTGLDGDEAPPQAQSAGEEEGDITSYRLGSKEHVNWGNLPSLHMICERFARSFQEDLSGSLLEDVVVDLKGFVYKPFQDFVDTLPMPSSFTICRLEPLQGSGVFIMEASMVTHLMDMFLGGKNQTHVKIEGRDFTSIERHFIQRVSSNALEYLQDGWESVHPISFEYQRTEVNPQFAMVIGAADMAVCCHFVTELNNTDTNFYMVFPYSALEPIKEKLASIFKGEGLVADEGWLRRVRERTLETVLEAELELGQTELPLGEITRWEVGDVIQLDNKVTDPLHLLVEHIPKFWGYPGEHDGYMAFQIYGDIEPEQPNNSEDNDG
ncbi:MAG: flagellar motor switch protein FliM [Leptospirillia bacterium]